jgi:hypothetical protein
LLEQGVSEELILAGVRIASVVHGAASALDARTLGNSVRPKKQPKSNQN